MESLSQAIGDSEKRYKTEKYNNRYWHNEINYIFKIRNNNKNGSLYGKIRNHIEVHSGDKTFDIRMRYYLNTTGSRSLEFDKNMNIIKGTKHKLEYFPRLP